MTYLKILILSMTILLLVGCASPLDNSYNKSKYENDRLLLKQKLSDEDFQLLDVYITAASIEGEKLNGMSYDDILQEVLNLKSELIEFNEDGNSKLSKTIREQFPITYNFSYDIPLKSKEITPHSITFLDGKIIIRGKGVKSEYTIKEVITDDKDAYHILIHGGDASKGKYEDYNLELIKGVAKTTRISDGAQWWYTDQVGKQMFEAGLDKAGMVFHR